MWVVEDDICANSVQMMMIWLMIVKMMFAQKCLDDVGSRGRHLHKQCTDDDDLAGDSKDDVCTKKCLDDVGSRG